MIDNEIYQKIRMFHSKQIILKYRLENLLEGNYVVCYYECLPHSPGHSLEC